MPVRPAILLAQSNVIDPPNSLLRASAADTTLSQAQEPPPRECEGLFLLWPPSRIPVRRSRAKLNAQQPLWNCHCSGTQKHLYKEFLDWIVIPVSKSRDPVVDLFQRLRCKQVDRACLPSFALEGA